MDADHHLTNWFGNAVSVGAIAGTMAGWLPAVSAIVALIWYMIQIYESKTVQEWIAARRARKIARLKARVILLEAQFYQPETPVELDPPRDL